ncbi:X-Pro dipeptidyl-peptidase-domain-containing protein [Apodospora peruviana]|uniref:X-Pro dipeptidyl-peptidase-domain-containing protein n=1 Tax=Apodospora peruviana TaxID=516989 RepID=A0AAE0HV45_9PEZI|nr:X-Pro dipeptidyl-peptidase-domain-containing protein [Apodospora peruviana]
MAPPTLTATKQTRGHRDTLFDQLAARSTKIPAERNNYTVQPVRIPVQDEDVEFELAADLYQPVLDDNQGYLGTVLAFGPYGRGVVFSGMLARPYAARGYQVLLVSCRGTYRSGGVFEPFVTEAHDGRAIVAWMREQAWYTGSFAMVGPSYMTYTQWAVLSDNPPDMVASVAAVGPHDFSRFCLGTGGAMTLDTIRWSDSVTSQEDPGWFPPRGPLRMVWQMLTADHRLKYVYESVSMIEAAERKFGDRAPWVLEFCRHPDLSDPHYDERWRRPTRALEVANIPILLMAGWHDIFLDQTIEQYRMLRERKVKGIALVVGPWQHTTVEDAEKETFFWLERHLSKVKPSVDPNELPVRVFVGGVKEWHRLLQWPPATKPLELYLRSGDQLSETKCTDESEEEPASSSFTFDPADPTPTYGGAWLGMSGGGSVVDTPLAARPDVLTFTTKPLYKDTEVMGAPSLELFRESDNPHVDIFFRLSEVDAKGVSRNITEGYRRLDSKRRPEDILPVTLVMKDCAHAFKKGTCIRLVLAGASSRIYHRNPGTSENGLMASSLRSAVHTIHHGKKGGFSRIILPVTSD